MKNKNQTLVQANTDQRRRFLRLFGTAAALIPITAIVGCSDEQAPAPASARSSTEPEPAPEPTATPDPEPMAQTEPQPEPDMAEPMDSAPAPADGDMPQVSLDDPTAQALGYKHDAANVDAAKYPQRGANQVCANCTLFQGANGDEWGGCALFPGKVVNANGWCSGYTPKA